MEQQYALKIHGQLSLFEQDNMSAEDRAWWIRRIERDMKEQAERAKQAQNNPRIPRR